MLYQRRCQLSWEGAAFERSRVREWNDDIEGTDVAGETLTIKVAIAGEILTLIRDF